MVAQLMTLAQTNPPEVIDPATNMVVLIIIFGGLAVFLGIPFYLSQRQAAGGGPSDDEKLARRIREAIAHYGDDCDIYMPINGVNQLVAGPSYRAAYGAPVTGVTMPLVAPPPMPMPAAMPAPVRPTAPRIDTAVTMKGMTHADIREQRTQRAVAGLMGQLAPRVSLDRIDLAAVPILYLDNGSVITLDFTSNEPHVRLCGASGRGKGNTQMLIAISCLSAGPEKAEVWIIDPKSGMDYRGFAMQVAHARLYADVYLLDDNRDPLRDEQGKSIPLFDGTILDGMTDVIRTMNDRNRIIGDADCVNLREYNAKVAPQHRLPIIVVMIDEAAALEAYQDRIAQITAMCRSAGMAIVICTQQPQASVLPTVIQANLHQSLVLGLTSTKYSEVALGHPKGHNYPYEPGLIDVPGIAIYRRNATEVIGRVPEMTAAVRTQAIAQLKARWPRTDHAVPQPVPYAQRSFGVRTMERDLADIDLRREPPAFDEPELPVERLSAGQRTALHLAIATYAWPTDVRPDRQRLGGWLVEQLAEGHVFSPDDLSWTKVVEQLYGPGVTGGKYYELARSAVTKLLPHIETILAQAELPVPLYDMPEIA